VGFTLVELLVVVAIISILAAIVVPNVADYIGQARAARALSEIKGAELALTKMLADSGKSSFRHFFATEYIYGKWGQDMATEFYTLLRVGKSASAYAVPLAPGVKEKLSSFYMDLGKDPWGQLYKFIPNTWSASQTIYSNQFRIYKADLDVPPLPQPDQYTLNDGLDPPTYWGYAPNPRLPVYIYSMGADGISSQVIYPGAQGGNAYDSDRLMDVKEMGGGDDINNWDNTQSWMEFY